MTNLPEKTFKAGSIEVAIWKNIIKTSEGTDFAAYTLTLQRKWKNLEGEWKQANSLRRDDIPKAQLLLGEAYKHILLKTNYPEPTPEEVVE